MIVSQVNASAHPAKLSHVATMRVGRLTPAKLNDMKLIQRCRPRRIAGAGHRSANPAEDVLHIFSVSGRRIAMVVMTKPVTQMI